MSSSKQKAKPSPKKLPKEAKVHRSGHSRAKRSGKSGAFFRALTVPVAVVAIVMLLVMALGYLGMGALSGTFDQPDSPKTESDASKASASKPEPAQTPPQAVEPKPQEPVAAPEDPDKEVLAKRSHIDRTAGAKESMMLDLYFNDGLKNGESLQPVEVKVPFNASTIRATVDQLIAAPSELKLYSNIPAGTKVRGTNLDKKTGVATVDLTAEAGAVQGSAAAHAVMASLVYSLTGLKDVKAVQLWVNGKPAMLHEIEWSKPLTRADMDAKAYFKVQPLVKFVP